MNRKYIILAVVVLVGVFDIAASQNSQQGAEREFPAGVTYLDSTAVLTAEDSGTVWKAAPGVRATISGGRKVTGWRKEDDGLWSAAVPWVADRERGFRHLVVNGVRHARAKEPNEGHFYSLRMKPPEYEGLSDAEFSFKVLKKRVGIKAGDINPRWKLANGELVFYHLWVDSHVLPDYLEIDANGTNWVHLSLPVRMCPTGQLWHLENLREIADRPGEWALAFDERRVYYRPMPGEDMAVAEVIAPCLQTLVRVDGARNVRFENLTFENARFELAKGDRNDIQAACTVGAAIVLTNAQDCVFNRCCFRNVGGYSIEMQAGTCGSRVLGCEFLHLGAGGVHLSGGCSVRAESATSSVDDVLPDPRTRVRNNEIADCEIADYGLDFTSAVGVLIRHAESTRVHHNDIHDGYYSGVSVGWVWGYRYSVARDNEITDNHIWNIGKWLISDMGGVYTLGVSPGTRICHNLIHDVYTRGYGGFGLYTDEGSSGILVEDNIVYNTKYGAYHMNYGRDCTVRNNIFAGCLQEQLRRSRHEREPHVSFSFYNNIVYWTQGQFQKGLFRDEATYEYNYKPGLRCKFLKTTLFDWNVYYNPNLSKKDMFFGGDDIKMTWEEWNRDGQDCHSVYADPLFKDVANHDYTLLPCSPALKMGFRQIDMTTIGRRRTD